MLFCQTYYCGFYRYALLDAANVTFNKFITEC